MGKRNEEERFNKTLSVFDAIGNAIVIAIPVATIVMLTFVSMRGVAASAACAIATASVTLFVGAAMPVLWASIKRFRAWESRRALNELAAKASEAYPEHSRVRLLIYAGPCDNKYADFPWRNALDPSDYVNVSQILAYTPFLLARDGSMSFNEPQCRTRSVAGKCCYLAIAEAKRNADLEEIEYEILAFAPLSDAESERFEPWEKLELPETYGYVKELRNNSMVFHNETCKDAFVALPADYITLLPLFLSDVYMPSPTVGEETKKD